jgi:hypothetical protein
MIVGDGDVMAYITGEAYSFQEAEAELIRLVERFGKHPIYGVWVAERNEDKAFVGIGGLIQVAEGALDLGYRVLKAYWGSGYGLEIAKLLIEKAKSGKMDYLVAEVELENEASLNILEKLGFEEVKIKRNEMGNEVGYFKLFI